MTRVLVLGPNGGVNLSTGGGARVAVEIAHALAEDRGMEVTLTALSGRPLPILDYLHGVRLSDPSLRVSTSYLTTADVNPLRSFLPTYSGVLLELVTKHLERTLKRVDPEIVIFLDDILSHLLQNCEGRLLFLYCTFPLLARIKYGNPDLKDKRPMNFLPDRIIYGFTRPLLSEKQPRCERVWAVSSVTAKVLDSLWPHCSSTVLYPPVDVDRYELGERDEQLVCCLGPIQPNKRYLDVLEALRSVPSARCVIAGHRREARYHAILLRTISRYGLTKRVSIRTDLSRADIQRLLSRASLFIHPARFEPFGIAVVEAMACGAVPLVFSGPNSGPWLDIIDHGKFGFGFRDNRELSDTLGSLLTDTRALSHTRVLVRMRAQEFSRRRFRERLVSDMTARGAP